MSVSGILPALESFWMKTLNKFHSKKQGKSVALAAAEARPRLSRIC